MFKILGFFIGVSIVKVRDEYCDQESSFEIIFKNDESTLMQKVSNETYKIKILTINFEQYKKDSITLNV